MASPAAKLPSESVVMLACIIFFFMLGTVIQSIPALGRLVWELQGKTTVGVRSAYPQGAGTLPAGPGPDEAVKSL
jgi:hypothetical protein